MSILRDDIQVALNGLHVAVQESSDHYLSISQTLQNSSVASVCEKIADMRAALAAELEAVIRDTGDLPSAPDRDREAAVEIRERLAALIAEDQVREIIQHRRESEEALLALIDGDECAVLRADHGELVHKSRESVDKALDLLASVSP